MRDTEDRSSSEFPVETFNKTFISVARISADARSLRSNFSELLVNKHFTVAARLPSRRRGMVFQKPFPVAWFSEKRSRRVRPALK